MTTSVVTGASTGIGRAIAQELGGPGNTVALLGRNIQGLNETAKLVSARGGTAVVVPCDLSSIESITEAAAQVVSRGRVDVIANVAGVWHNSEKAYQGPLLFATPASEIAEVLDAGLRGNVILTSLLLPAMVPYKAGHVINISGTFSSGAKGWLHYYISKKGMESFTVGLAQELRDSEIQVNCVSPADVATEAYLRFYPEYAASAVKPEEVAEVVRTLLEPAMRHVSGAIMEVRNRKDHE